LKLNSDAPLSSFAFNFNMRRYIKDDSEDCTGWASSGECTKNPAFMFGTCKESCGACTSAPALAVDPAAVGYATLNTGAKMPLVGYGTAGLGQHTKQAVAWAVQAGYRMLDSGQAREWYREDLVGRGQGLTLVHVMAQLEQPQDTFRSYCGYTADRGTQIERKWERW